MKKLLVIILSIHFLGMLSGQTNTPLILLNDSIVGTSHDTGFPMKATRYDVSGKINKWYWDGVSENLLLELSGLDRKGPALLNEKILTMIDLETKEVKWTRTMNHKTSELKQQSNYYFLTDKKKNQCLDPETGNTLWESKCDFYFIDPFLNIGVGYPVQSTSNKLSAIDLSNGRLLWEKKIDRSYGWDDAYMLNDSILLIAVNGIHAIDLRNGREWNYKAKTAKKEIGKMIAINFLGILVGALTDSYFYQSQADVVSDMTSNMLIDPDDNVLHASRDMISRIDTWGNIIWSKPLPEKLTSSSSLFLIDSVVYLINRGYAQYNGEFSMIGDPYFAAFNLEDGNRFYLKKIPEKKEFIRHYQVIGDMLFILFEDKIDTYRLSDGSLIKETKLALQNKEELDVFMQPEGIYLKQNDTLFTDLAVDFGDYNLIKTTEGRFFVMNDSLETLITLDKEKLFYKIIDNPHYTLISQNESDYVVLDASDHAQASFTDSANMFLRNNKICFFDDHTLYEIDLDRLHQAPSIWHSIFKQVSRYLPAPQNKERHTKITTRS